MFLTYAILWYAAQGASRIGGVAILAVLGVASWIGGIFDSYGAARKLAGPYWSSSAGSSGKGPAPQAPQEPAILQLPGDDTFPLQVVGESHYQDAFEILTGGRTEDGVQQLVTCHLVLDDSNPYDPNAVKVLVTSMVGATYVVLSTQSSFHVGHLSRRDAVAYRQWLKDHGHGHVIGVCNGRIRGGWDRGGGDIGSFGLLLDFPLYGSASR